MDEEGESGASGGGGGAGQATFILIILSNYDRQIGAS